MEDTTFIHPSVQKRTMLLAETSTLDEFCESFDLSAFPLPMRIATTHHGLFCDCKNYTGDTAHVFMKILPRNASELRSLARDGDGMLELRTCTGVSVNSFQKDGVFVALERTRVAIKNMVLHEVYEALLFRKERILDPHNHHLKPADQPF